MGYDIIKNIESCYVDVPGLLYYSHIPPTIVVLLFGLFVLIKSNKNRLVGKILFAISLIFATWSVFDIILWNTYSSQTMMFLWPLFGTLYVLMYILGFYFVNVFIDDADISLKKKIFLVVVSLPIIFLTPSEINLPEFSVANCEPVEGKFFIGYQYFLGILLLIMIISTLVSKYRKITEADSKKKVLLSGIGILFFLLAFSWSEIIGSLTLDWEITQYSLFTMPVFIGFLAYLIVKYQAFNIKLLGTQALVAALVIIIGAELFFVESTTNIVLVLITLAISLGFGYMLIKSVKMEVQRKEELQRMSDELARKNDQLRKLDNAKSEFISIASHQLRTPLTAIKGFISLLLEGSYGELQPKHQEVLNKVYLSNERLIGLVEDLLNISRIESGRMEYKFDTWSLEKICSEVVDTFVLRAKERNLYLDYKKSDRPLPEVMTDGGKLREVISNLVDNALKYTQRGGVSVRVRQEGESVQVSVTDTGIGIPKEELPYLFSKFSRGKDTNRLNTGGTGLGLYVGKSIIEALGGKVWAESEGAGKGSHFIIEIPIERKEEEQS